MPEPAATFDVVVVGSANLDLVTTGERIPRPGETVLGRDFNEHPGGKGLNQAVACSRAGAAVALIAAVGHDEAGQRLKSVATADAIDTTTIATVDRPTGRAVITVDDSGENSIVVIPGANSECRVDDLPPAAVALAQLEIPIATVIRAFEQARDIGIRTLLNPAPAAELPDRLLQLCDVIIPNEHEVGLLGGVERLMDHGVEVVIVTRGAAGVDVTSRHAGHWTCPAFPVIPVDTTGAGDAFCGALAAKLAIGWELADAVRWAAAAGALATTVRGAVPSLPRRIDIDRLAAPSHM